jgi:hypothetical protein
MSQSAQVPGGVVSHRHEDASPEQADDFSTAPILDLSKDEQVAVQDVDTNLVRVDITADQFLSLGGLVGETGKLTVFMDPAVTQGLRISGNETHHLVIESALPGQTFDIDQVNHLLGTLSYTPAHAAGITTDVFPHLTITATDAAGATDTQTLSSSSIAIEAHTTSTAFGELYDADEPASSHGEDDAAPAWAPGDLHAAGEHDADTTIYNFNGAAHSDGGDVLDLRELLQVGPCDPKTPGSLDQLLNFLDFDTQSQPGSTVIHVSASGGFRADASGHSDSSHCTDLQHIVLSDVDIRGALGLDARANDQQIIAELLQRGKLLVEPG